MRARALVSIAFLCACLGPGVARAEPQPPPDDPFYKAPRGLAKAEPGHVFRTREVSVKLGGLLGRGRLSARRSS